MYSATLIIHLSFLVKPSHQTMGSDAVNSEQPLRHRHTATLWNGLKWQKPVTDCPFSAPHHVILYLLEHLHHLFLHLCRTIYLLSAQETVHPSFKQHHWVKIDGALICLNFHFYHWILSTTSRFMKKLHFSQTTPVTVSCAKGDFIQRFKVPKLLTAQKLLFISF